MECRQLLFSGHAVRRMFDRQIREHEVRQVIESGDIITEYLDDKPFPSRLILGFVRGRPLHVVVAANDPQSECYVITVYVPDPAQWQPDYRSRRS